MECTKGLLLKQRFADKMVKCNTHFESDQLVAVLDICDELGIPDMYEALMMLYRYSMIHLVEGVIYPEGTHKDWVDKANKALAKTEGK